MPVPARPRRLPPLPAAVVPGARGVDARLRRRRPDAHLGGARRRGGVPTRSPRPRTRPGSGIVLDIVPNHMATDDAQPLLGGPGAARRSSSTSTRRPGATGASSTSTTSPACARRTRRCSRRRTSSRSRSSREGVVDGLRIDHPDGLADPAGYLERLRDGGAAHVWVEKILDPGEQLRDWPVEGTVGYEFLNDVAALFVDPAGEAPLTALWDELSGDDAPVRRGARTRPSSSRSRGPFAPEVERLRGECAARGRRTSSARSPSLPVYRTYVEPRSGRRRGRRPRGDRARPACRSRCARADAQDAAGRVRHALPADDAARSWPRASRTPPSTATRGCSRSTTSAATRAASASRRRASTRATPSAPALPAQPAGHADARHQALGRRARADRRAGRDGRGLGGATCAAGSRRARRCAGRTPSSATSSSRRWSARGRSSPSGSRPTWRRRCARPSATRTGSSPTTAYEDRVKAFCRELYEHRPFLADFEPFAAEVARAGRARRARPAAAQAHRPGRARHLPGRRAARALARRSRQPPPGRLGCAAARCSPRSPTAPRPTDETRKLQLIVRALTLRARRPEAFAGAYEPLDAGPDACAFVRGGVGPRRGGAARRRARRDGRPPDRHLARRARRARPGRPRRPDRPGRGARDRVARANCPVASGAPCAR